MITMDLSLPAVALAKSSMAGSVAEAEAYIDEAKQEVSSLIATAIEEGTAVVIDQSLDIEGAAAESKVVGGRFDEQSQRIAKIESDIADAYDETVTYSDGDYAMFDGVLKKYNGTTWAAVTVTDEMVSGSGETLIKFNNIAQTPDSDGYINVPIGGYTEQGAPILGLFSVDYGFYGGLYKTLNGYDNPGILRVKKCSHNAIDSRTASDYFDTGTYGDNHCSPVVPAQLDYAVKAAMTDGIGAAWTDAEKTGAWQRMNSIKTTMDSVAVAGAQYYLGEISTLNIVMPENAHVGQKIVVCFSSGVTPCALTCDLTGFDFVPKANKFVELIFRLVHKKNVTVTGDDDEWAVEIKEE